eukprot:Gb_22862 [translate_table: standard]
MQPCSKVNSQFVKRFTEGQIGVNRKKIVFYQGIDIESPKITNGWPTIDERERLLLAIRYKESVDYVDFMMKRIKKNIIAWQEGKGHEIIYPSMLQLIINWALVDVEGGRPCKINEVEVVETLLGVAEWAQEGKGRMRKRREEQLPINNKKKKVAKGGKPFSLIEFVEALEKKLVEIAELRTEDVLRDYGLMSPSHDPIRSPSLAGKGGAFVPDDLTFPVNMVMGNVHLRAFMYMLQNEHWWGEQMKEYQTLLKEAPYEMRRNPGMWEEAKYDFFKVEGPVQQRIEEITCGSFLVSREPWRMEAYRDAMHRFDRLVDRAQVDWNDVFSPYYSSATQGELLGGLNLWELCIITRWPRWNIATKHRLAEVYFPTEDNMRAEERKTCPSKWLKEERRCERCESRRWRSTIEDGSCEHLERHPGGRKWEPTGPGSPQEPSEVGRIMEKSARDA